MKNQTESRNRIQVNIHLQALATSHWNRRCTVRISDVRVVRQRVGHIKRSIDVCGGLWRALRLRIVWLRITMNGVPWLRTRRQEVSSGRQRCNLVSSQIVRLGAAKLLDLIYPFPMIEVIQGDRSVSN